MNNQLEKILKKGLGDYKTQITKKGEINILPPKTIIKCNDCKSELNTYEANIYPGNMCIACAREHYV